MPRQRGGARPAARPAPARAPAQQQTRPASTAVAPAQRAPPPAVAQQGSQGPGLFGQVRPTSILYFLFFLQMLTEAQMAATAGYSSTIRLFKAHDH